MTITYKTNKELWKLANSLKLKGFKKTADCYWVQVFTDGNTQITLKRE